MAKRTKKTRLVIIAALLLLLASAGLAYVLVNRDNKAPDQFINYNGPTAEEKAAGDKQKDEVTKRNELENSHNNNVSAGDKQTATIVLSDADQYGDSIEVRAYITNLLEDGGICTAKFVHNGTTVTVTSKAFKDATTTQCGQLDLDRSKFNSSGNWQLTIMYESSTAQGSIDGGSVVIK